MDNFKLHRHDLTYYFDELFNLCHGGCEDFFEKERRQEDSEYRHKRQDETEKVLDCARKILTSSELQCFYLFFFDDVSQERIADVMEISQPAVNKFLRKSIEKIRRNMTEEKNQLLIDFVVMEVHCL
jgi:RNA polymerase sigma factor (sigma-70 family)